MDENEQTGEHINSLIKREMPEVIIKLTCLSHAYLNYEDVMRFHWNTFSIKNV
jgi:hypothetical protein